MGFIYLFINQRVETNNPFIIIINNTNRTLSFYLILFVLIFIYSFNFNNVIITCIILSTKPNLMFPNNNNNKIIEL